MNNNDDSLCIHCNKPVVFSKKDYEIYYHMHYICYHFIYEHNVDQDEACRAPSCPLLRIKIYEQKLQDLGYNPLDLRL